MAFVKTRCQWIVRVKTPKYASKPQKTARDAMALARSMVAAGFRPTIHRSCSLRKER